MAANRFSENVKRLDLFSQDIEILFENNKSKLQSHCGVLMTFLMGAILASFAYYKVNVMLEYQRIYLQEPTEVHYFDSDFSFDSSYGWEVAFGLTKYDYKDPMIQPDASYG